jgi:TetR/AcrR family fatty acid metabolism transcriptional regulator
VHSETKPSGQSKPSFIETARRAQIIECAIDAIAELGFAQASLAQIAKRAGVSTGVILYYFTGADFISPPVNAQTTARAAIRSFIEASVAFLATHPNHTRAVMNIIRSGRTADGAPAFDPAVVQPRQAGFRSILEWGQREGEFRPFAVGVMVETIIEALDAIPPQLAADPNLDLDAYARELVELFDRATRADESGLKEPTIR